MLIICFCVGAAVMSLPTVQEGSDFICKWFTLRGYLWLRGNVVWSLKLSGGEQLGFATHIMLPHIQIFYFSLAPLPNKSTIHLLQTCKNGCKVNITDTLYSIYTVYTAGTNPLTAHRHASNNHNV